MSSSQNVINNVQGNYVYINQLVASSSTSLAFTGLSNAYSAYKFIVINLLPDTPGTNLNIYMSTNNGSSYDSSSGNYQNSNYFTNTTSFFYTGGSANSNAIVSVSAAGTPNSINSTIDFYNADNASQNPVFITQGSYYSATQSSYVAGGSMGVYTNGTSAGAINAVQFATTTGTFVSGTVTLYGLST